MPEGRIPVPEELMAEIDRRLAAGEFQDARALIAEALRYYFDRHRSDDWSEYVRKEAAWSRQHGGA